jgi:hypothetical protein
MAEALAAVSISGLAFRLLNKVIQEGLKKEVIFSSELGVMSYEF